MKIGANGLIWGSTFGTDQLDLLPRLREHGFDAFELPMFDPKALPIAAIRKTLEANGLEGTVCAILPAGLSPIDADADVRRKTLTHLQDCVQAAVDLGAKIIAGPVYAPVGYLTRSRRTQEEWQRAIDCFQALAASLDANAIDLALEPLNRFETFFLTTAAEAQTLCLAVGHPRIGVLLDTFHTNIEERDVTEAFTSLGSLLKHVHISENDRGIPGTGHVDFASLLQGLRQVDYRGLLVIESFSYLIPELATATAIWRDLAPSPEAIALEGIRYLRSVLGNTR